MTAFHDVVSTIWGGNGIGLAQMHYSLMLRNQICTISSNKKQELKACNTDMTMLETAELDSEAAA